MEVMHVFQVLILKEEDIVDTGQNQKGETPGMVIIGNFFSLLVFLFV